MTATNKSLVDHVSDATMKGKVLGLLAGQAQGYRSTAVLDLTGVLVDGETFKLGAAQFEINDCSTAETATGTTSSTTDVSVALSAAPDRDFVKGEVFGIGSEYVKVTSHLPGAQTVYVERGYAGSTAATHSGATITRVAAARLPLTGNYIIPVDDLTQAEGAAKIAAAVPALVSSYGARVTGTNDVTFDTAYADSHPANSESFTNATLANFSGGQDSLAAGRKAYIVHSVTAGEATAGTIDFVLDFTPSAFIVQQFDADGSPGTAGTVGSATANVLTVTEGAAAWAAGDLIVIEAYE